MAGAPIVVLGGGAAGFFLGCFIAAVGGDEVGGLAFRTVGGVGMVPFADGEQAVVPPVQAGWASGSMSSAIWSPALPQVVRV